MTLTTTLKQLKEHNACESGLETLIKSLPDLKDTTPIPLSHILGSNGLDHAIWALRTQDKKHSVLFAAECAERVLHIFEQEFPADDRPRKALEAARNWLADPSSDNERTAAARAAWSAARAAWSAAWSAARAAAAAARAAEEEAARAAAEENEAQKEIYLKIVS